MAKKIIKHRLFTWFENVPSSIDPNEESRVERIATLGQEVDITDDASLKRGEELGSFYTDEEAKAIREGTYQGVDADALGRAREGQFSAPTSNEEVDDVSGSVSGSLDVKSASSEEIGEFIKENKLNVEQTKRLVPDDADVDLLEKLYDAESYASDNDPRKGVADYLDAKLAAASQS